MKLEKWKNFTSDEIVAFACVLYEILGAERLDPMHRDKIWRDDSLKGGSAIYSITHGFLLGTPQNGLTVQISENWVCAEPADGLVAAAVRIQSSGQIGFSATYRHGLLRVEARALPAAEERCAVRFSEPDAP